MPVTRKQYTRRYYFWFFGYVAKLPWKQEVEFDDPFYWNDSLPGSSPESQ